MREIVNAIFYILRGGIAWSLLPKDFLPWPTAYRWFARFRDDGARERINHHLVMLDRERTGREASPTAAVINSQSVKTTESGGIRGGACPRAGEAGPVGRREEDQGPQAPRHGRYRRPGSQVAGHSAAIQDRDGAGSLLRASCRATAKLAIRGTRLCGWRLHGLPGRRRQPNPHRGGARPTIRSASRSSPGVGWSNASSPGSTATGGSPRTSRPASKRRGVPLRRFWRAPAANACTLSIRFEIDGVIGVSPG